MYKHTFTFQSLSLSVSGLDKSVSQPAELFSSQPVTRSKPLCLYLSCCTALPSDMAWRQRPSQNIFAHCAEWLAVYERFDADGQVGDDPVHPPHDTCAHCAKRQCPASGSGTLPGVRRAAVRPDPPRCCGQPCWGHNGCVLGKGLSILQPWHDPSGFF